MGIPWMQAGGRYIFLYLHSRPAVMNKKTILLIPFVLVLLYPILAAVGVEQVLRAPEGLDEAEGAVGNFQVSIWISWVVMAVIAVYYKWTEKSNFFFSLAYVVLVVAFVFFGAYTQRVITQFDLPSSFRDGYTMGVLIAAQNILVAGILTGFLQAAVWWFTRRWHRR